jgi:hypothetical protein
MGAQWDHDAPLAPAALDLDATPNHAREEAAAMAAQDVIILLCVLR